MSDPTYANGWFRSRSYADGVTLLWESQIKPQFRANIWLVRGRDRNLLVDSGFGVVSLVEHIPALDANTTLAVATHSHCDHIGSHHEFAHCEIHLAEAAILRHPTLENTAALGYVSDAMFEHGAPAGFDADAFSIRSCEPSRLLFDGDIIDLGDRSFEVLHIPGHSPGSIGLFEAETGILFSGDVVHNGSSGIGRYILYHSDLDDWLASVERLRRIPVRTVHAGHFDSFGGDRYIEILDEYLERRRTPGFPLQLNTY
jgi:glyoxylase-like metal-dependent hydrolase (beta-lactamase superfamily II)